MTFVTDGLTTTHPVRSSFEQTQTIPVLHQTNEEST